MHCLLGVMSIVFALLSECSGNPDAKRLYDDLLSNYNKLVRPVVNVTDALTVKIKLKLSQLIDVNLKNQIMTTNLWVEQNDELCRELQHLRLESGQSIVDMRLIESTQNFLSNKQYPPPPPSYSHTGIGFVWNELLIKCLSDGPFEFPRNKKTEELVMEFFVKKSWYDYKLQWDPKEYGGVEMLHVPSDHIWRPDIVLYNNADGNFEVTLATKATLNYTGRVEWKPPAIYKSSCEIDVEYFPFDEQTCVMKFGSWTYDGFQVDLRHIDEAKGSNVVKVGIDLSEFYTSVEWDILEVPAVRNEKFYTCCDEPYLDITFNITMRRKTLFYTVNLIIPCMGISFLTVLVFYLPSDSGEKVSLSISILLSLTVFFLLLAEIIPPTSLVVPLLGKFVLFTMILDTFSICVTVVVLNVHFRSPQTHTMAPWVRRVFIHVLPRLLVMRRPHYQIDRRRYYSSANGIMVRTCNGIELRDPAMYAETSASELLDNAREELYPRDEYTPQELEAMALSGSCRIHGTPILPPLCHDPPPYIPKVRGPSPYTGEDLNGVPSSPICRKVHHWHHCPELHKAIDGVKYIADHTKKEEDDTRVKEDWKYVAMVLDRLFLWIFTLAVLVGTAGIILQAPTLYDDRIPIDVRLSEIASTTAKPHVATAL